MSDPLRTAADVMQALALYANNFGTAGEQYQERKKDFALILRGAAKSAPEHNIYGRKFVERLADLIEEV